MDIKEVAYHEAGHAVVGFLFYPPIVKTTIIPSDGCFGNTICEIPNPILFEEFDNYLLFPEYFKIALYCWAGEYFQKIINPMLDINGLKNDKELFDFYFFKKERIEAFVHFKDSILKSFFTNEITTKITVEVAEKLLMNETLYHSDIELILSKYTYDFEQQIILLMDEFYISICKYCSEF